MLTGGAEAARGRRGWYGVGLGTLPLVSIMIPPMSGVGLGLSKSRGKVLKCGVLVWPGRILGGCRHPQPILSLWTFIES